VVGYFAAWNVYARGFHIKNLVTSGAAPRLTHLNYAFANIQNNRCVLGDPEADTGRFYDASSSVDGSSDSWDAGRLRGSFHQLQQLKKKFPQLKVLMSIGGWSWSSQFPSAATPAQRKAFVTSCVDLFLRNPQWPGLFDGIDVDWEYPGVCGATCNQRPEDTQNFTGLLQEFRTQLNAIQPSLELTIAAPAFGEAVDKMDVPAVSSILTRINVMTYDLHGGWEKTTNFHGRLHPSPADPTFSQKLSVEESISTWQSRGAPVAKLVLGVPFYGRGWQGVATANDGLYQSATGPAPASVEEGMEDYRLLSRLGPAFREHRDPVSQSFWRYNPSTGIFWSYDDAEALRAKRRFVTNQRLGGVMIWELGGDDDAGTLVHALTDSL
jgi:chitinase